MQKDSILQTQYANMTDAHAVRRKNVFPAQDSQKRLWFIHQLQPDSPVYNIFKVVEIDGEINPQSLGKAVNAIIERHEALRTTFHALDEKVFQTIHPKLQVELPVIDMQERPEEVQTMLNRYVKEPFDLIKGPLIRVYLIQKSPQKYVFLFVVHHMVFDRRSLGLLNKELTEFYRHFEEGATPQLEELVAQYADYSEWRLKKLNETDLTRPWQYWQKKLASVEPLTLPYDRHRSFEANTNGKRLYLDIPTELVEKFEKVASAKGVTLFMGVMALFKLLVFRWSGETDLLTGTPFADRRMKGCEELFGFFVNTLVLRSDLSGEPTFSELLGRIRKTCFDAYRYNSMPLDKIIERLHPDRLVNRNPLFDLDFQVQRLHAESLVLGDARITEINAERGSSQYDLGFALREKTDTYTARFEYRTDLFEEKTIVRLLQRFKLLMEAVVEDCDKPLSDYAILLPDEYQLLVESRNQTEQPIQEDARFYKQFLENAEKTPEKIAVISEAGELTYQQLKDKAVILYNELLAQGVKPGDMVAMLLSRSEFLAVSMIATHMAGATYLPLDPEYPESRIQYILQDAQAKFVILERALDGLIETESTTRIYAQEVIAAEANTQLDTVPQHENSLAYVIYTSGSTGNPKGVMITQRNLLNFLQSMSKEPGLSADDTLLAVTTISFDIAVLEILLPLFVGGKTIIADRLKSYDPTALASLIEEHEVTVMQATPSTWQMMVSSGWQGKQNLKLLTGGEALPAKLSKQLQDLAGEVWNMYGPTETTVWSTCCQLLDDNKEPSIGKPIDNTQIYVLDEKNRLVPDGVFGELCIGGEGVAAGYMNRAELNAERFIRNPFDKQNETNIYKTGDLVRYGQNADLEYAGRLDFQVKVRGYRIELGEIESALEQFEMIEQAVVAVRESHDGDKRIVAYYILNDLEQFDLSLLKNYLNEKLPAFMVPQNFEQLDEFPLTPNGKVDRKKLPQPTFEEHQVGEDFVEASTETEKKLVAIWQEMIGIENISVDSRFFDAGGHSLLAMQVIARVKNELGTEISPLAMIRDSLEQIAASIDGVSKKPSRPAAASATETITPYFFGADNSLFGSYHRPMKQVAPKGAVLLCSPIYMEGINAHWAYRRLATQLVAAGFEVLRFDYFGTGDSLGDDAEGNVDIWCDNVRQAASELRQRAKCDSISVVGLRFGATIASLANLSAIDKLVLWEPVIQGQLYVDDLRAKYKDTLKELNYIRSQSPQFKENELVGFDFPQTVEHSISNAQLLEGDSLKKAGEVVLVTSTEQEKFAEFFDDFYASCQHFEFCTVDDTSPKIENYTDLGAYLPGKSLNTIVNKLKVVR